MKTSDLINERLKNLESTIQQLKTSPRQENNTETPVGHKFLPGHKRCIDCDADNPKYEKPNVYCPTCGIPMGRLPEGFEGGDTDDIKPCVNCGGTHGVKHEFNSDSD
jgi:hypothetical protein